MDLAEDIPALLPVSIALVVLLIGLSSVMVGYAKKTQISDMHRFALEAVEQVAYYNGMILKEEMLDDCDWAIESSQYKTKMYVRDLDRDREWSCGEDNNHSVIVSVPIIVRADEDHAGKLYIGVMP